MLSEATGIVPCQTTTGGACSCFIMAFVYVLSLCVLCHAIPIISFTVMFCPIYTSPFVPVFVSHCFGFVQYGVMLFLCIRVIVMFLLIMVCLFVLYFVQVLLSVNKLLVFLVNNKATHQFCIWVCFCD